MIDRLQTLGIFACHCTPTDAGIHCGILVTNRVAGIYNLTDPETGRVYSVQLPELSHHLNYNLSLSNHG